MEREGDSMRIVVTGADGFIGRKVVDRLLAAGGLGEGFAPMTSLHLLDLHIHRRIDDPRVTAFEGSFLEPELRARALAGGVDVLFHLVSLAGGAAQANFKLGRQVNLEGPLALLDEVCNPESPPIVVNASSIGAIGPGGPGDVIPDDVVLRPQGSYGAHKAMIEYYVADLTSRGWIDGRSLRPSGIVPRPREVFEGFATAWMSDIFHAMAAGEPITLPCGPEASTWLQSVGVCADAFIHAARLPAEGLPAHRSWTIPPINANLGELVAAIAEETSPDSAAKVSFAGGGQVTKPADLPKTTALGFRSDGDLKALVRNALAELRSNKP